MARHRIDRALGNISAFRPAVAAISVDRHCISDDNARNCFVIVDLVGAGAEVDGVHGWAATCHVGEISAHVAERRYLQANDSTVVLEGDFNILGMGPTMPG